MHGEDNNQDAIFSYESLEKRKPVDRPLRPILAVKSEWNEVDGIGHG